MGFKAGFVPSQTYTSVHRHLFRNFHHGQVGWLVVTGHRNLCLRVDLGYHQQQLLHLSLFVVEVLQNLSHSDSSPNRADTAKYNFYLSTKLASEGGQYSNTHADDPYWYCTSQKCSGSLIKVFFGFTWYKFEEINPIFLNVKLFLLLYLSFVPFLARQSLC